MLNEHDEFYTTFKTVSSELDNYSDSFNGKTIYLNCDKPHVSEFWNYFEQNFNTFNLKALMSTYFGGNVLTILTKNGEKQIKIDNNGSF